MSDTDYCYCDCGRRIALANGAGGCVECFHCCQVCGQDVIEEEEA